MDTQHHIPIPAMTLGPEVVCQPPNGACVQASQLAAAIGAIRATNSGSEFLGNGLVQLGGFEPPTSGSTIRRSNQLSYNCIDEKKRETRGVPLRKQGFKGVAAPHPAHPMIAL